MTTLTSSKNVGSKHQASNQGQSSSPDELLKDNLKSCILYRVVGKIFNKMPKEAANFQGKLIKREDEISTEVYRIPE